MAGYTRQSTADIQTGEDVLAAPLNAEFNAIRDAFNGSTGHEHDGTTGNGPKIDLTSSVSGVLPVANGGIAAIHKLNATTAPAVGDDSGDRYGVGSIWIDTTNDKFYICVDASLGAAVWKIFQPYSAILDEYAAVDPTAAGLALLDDADASAQRTTLGLVIGTNVQAYDAGLQSISGLTTSSDKTIYTTGSDTYATTDLTSFGRSLIDDADASAARTTLGVVIGTNVQAYDAGLQSISGLTTSSDKMIYTTGSDTYAVSDLSSFARTLLDDADASAARTTLNAQELNSALTSISGLTTSADKTIYTTGSNTYAVTSLTSFGRSLIDDVDASAGRTTLGLGTISTQASSNVNISGGSITGITDLAIADGGTGASNASDALTNLGINSQLQATWEAGVGTTESVVSPAKIASAIVALAPAASSASESTAGVVELATTSEATTGTDTARAVTPAGVKAAIDDRIPTSSTLPVGTCTLMRYASDTALTDGSTTSGSNVYTAISESSAYGTIFSDSGGTQQTGTWRNISGVTLDQDASPRRRIGLMVRIS